MPVPTLAFDGFLGLLRTEGFPIGIDSWLRVQALLESCDGRIDPSRLKTVLCPLVATSPEEQRRFYDAFDRYYTALAANAIPQFAARRQVERRPTPGRPKRYWKIAAAAVIICALVPSTLAIRGYYTAGKGQPSQPKSGLQTRPNGNAGGVSPERNSPPATPLVQVDAQPVDTTRLDRLRVVWSIPAALLAIYALWFGLRRFAGGYLVRRRSRLKRPWSRAIAAQVPIPAAPAVNQNVRRLRRRIPVPSIRLDLPRTIEGTIRAAGFPQLRFRSGTRRPEYLVLIDRIASRDHQAALFHQLIGTLRERGQLAIEEYFFTRDPRVCVSAKSGTAVYLADLLQRCAAHRMLIFGDGAALWNSMTGERVLWMDLLDGHPQSALLTPNTGGWTAREHALSEWMLVRPATLEGLSQVLDAFEERPEPPLPHNAPHVPEYPAVESKERIGAYVDSLRRYLGASGFRLAAACGLYPRLEWDLTLHLAAAVDLQLLDHSKLLKLAALPWFRKGFYPIALQQQLFERVPKKERRHLRQRIVELIEEGTASVDGQAALEVLVQKFDLSPGERQRLARDEAFARLALTAGVSRLALRIPEAVRRSLFRFGVPAFGLRFWAAGALAIPAAAGIIAAATILPAVPPLKVSFILPKPPADANVVKPKPCPASNKASIDPTRIQNASQIPPPGSQFAGSSPLRRVDVYCGTLAGDVDAPRAAQELLTAAPDTRGFANADYIYTQVSALFGGAQLPDFRSPSGNTVKSVAFVSGSDQGGYGAFHIPGTQADFDHFVIDSLNASGNYSSDSGLGGATAIRPEALPRRANVRGTGRRFLSTALLADETNESFEMLTGKANPGQTDGEALSRVLDFKLAPEMA